MPHLQASEFSFKELLRQCNEVMPKGAELTLYQASKSTPKRATTVITMRGGRECNLTLQGRKALVSLFNEVHQGNIALTTAKLMLLKTFQCQLLSVNQSLDNFTIETISGVGAEPRIYALRKDGQDKRIRFISV